MRPAISFHAAAVAIVAAIVLVFVVVGAAGCPTTRACKDSNGCLAGEACLNAADGTRTCQPDVGVPDAGSASDGGVLVDAGIVDAGALEVDAGIVDAGAPEVDAGFDDAGVPLGRTLHGVVDVGAAVMRAPAAFAHPARTLRGHVTALGPTSLAGATHSLSR